MATTYTEKLRHPKWQKKRLEVLQRDEFTCRMCGSEEKTLHVHHISYNGNPWETPIENLITLCEGCHEIEEENLSCLKNDMVRVLQDAGFMSNGLREIVNLFRSVPDRGWNEYDPIWDILRQILCDDELMQEQQDKYFAQLRGKNKDVPNPF